MDDNSISQTLPIEDEQLYGTSYYDFIDHGGETAVAVYSGQQPTPQASVLPPQWSFQVYVTFQLDGQTTLQAVAIRLLEAIETDRLEVYPLRLDVYHLVNATHDQCMQHYRREKQARAASPSMQLFVPAYMDEVPNFLIILDHADWAEPGQGVATVQFDPPPAYRQDPSSEFYVSDEVYTQAGVPVGQGPSEVAAVYGRASRDEESGAWECNLFEVMDSLKLNEWFADWQERYEEIVEGGRDTW